MVSSLRLTSTRLFILSLLLVLCWTTPGAFGTPVELAEREAAPEPEAEDGEWLYKRTYFPDYPPSCKICEQNYDRIDSCANASVVFANITEVIYAPLQFLSVINCACTDTFKSAYPQCVDCFLQTNQTAFLEPENGANLSTIVTNIRQICALGSAIFGGVASANSQLPGQTPITVASAGAALRGAVNLFSVMGTGRTVAVAIGTMVMGVGMGVWTVL